MPRDRSLQLFPPVGATFDEGDVRRKAKELVGEHWPELSKRVARWLGTAFREDDSLVGEVALIMLRRYGNGHGRLVAHLRDNGDVSPSEAKQVLFGEAKMIFREVLPRVVDYRRRCQRLVEWPDDHAATTEFGVASETDTLDAGQCFGDTRRLLRHGARVWDSLCVAGLLDQVSWTDDQKWTAIAMMWDFSVDEVTEIRSLKAPREGTPHARRAATRQMMRTVRRKGRILVDALPREQRREYDLLGRG